MKAIGDPVVWDQLPSTPVPALVLIAPTNKGAREEIYRQVFPNLTMRRMEKGGHFFMMETPDVFNRLVVDWLTTH